MSDQTAPVPQVPCSTCASFPRGLDDTSAICWCPHTMTGGIYLFGARIWHVLGPFKSEAQFRQFLAASFAPQSPALPVLTIN